MSLKLAGAAAAAMGVIVTSTSVAHHSFAMFDGQKEIVLEGTIREFQWKNPHVWLQVLVTDSSGTTTEWGVESLNTMALQRQGWKRNSFNPGDKITIVVNPRIDGKPMGAFVRATLADGKTFVARDADNTPVP